MLHRIPTGCRSGVKTALVSSIQRTKWYRYYHNLILSIVTLLVVVRRVAEPSWGIVGCMGVELDPGPVQERIRRKNHDNACGGEALWNTMHLTVRLVGATARLREALTFLMWGLVYCL